MKIVAAVDSVVFWVERNPRTTLVIMVALAFAAVVF
jgi:hypothetical protein